MFVSTPHPGWMAKTSTPSACRRQNRPRSNEELCTTVIRIHPTPERFVSELHLIASPTNTVILDHSSIQPFTKPTMPQSSAWPISPVPQNCLTHQRSANSPQRATDTHRTRSHRQQDYRSMSRCPGDVLERRSQTIDTGRQCAPAG